MKKEEISNFLNSLNNEEQNALQVAVLLGDALSIDFVIDLTDIRPSQLITLLNEMTNKKIIKEKPGNEKCIYLFTNKNFSNIVLDLMGEEKKRLHLSNIIDYMERNLSPRNDKKTLILAELFLKFKNDKDCLQYKKKAADLLSSAHKTEEALDLYKEIIDELLAKNRDSLEDILLIDSILSYAPVAINLRPFEDIVPVVDKAIILADNLQNSRAEAMLKLCLGRLFQCKGNISEASVHYNEGWTLAQKIGDKALLKTGSKLLALSLFWQGRIKEAIHLYEETIGSSEDTSFGLKNIWAHLILACCYGITGRVARGVGLAESIRERAVSMGYMKTQAFAHIIIALILLEVRQIENAVPHIDKALEIAEKINSEMVLWMAKPCKAYELYSKGDLKGAKELFESVIPIMKRLNQLHYPSPWLIEIFWSLHRANWSPIEGYSFDSEITRLMNWPNLFTKGAALRYYAIDKKLSGATSYEIKDLLEQSQKLLTKAGALVELGRTQVELARLYTESKENRKAKIFANMAYRTFSKIDTALFPSELSSLIQRESRETCIYHGISELNDAINSLPNYNAYFGRVVTILTDMFGAERAAVLLIKEDGISNGLDVAAARNFSPEELQQFSNGSLLDLISNTINRKESLIVSDPKKSQKFLQIATEDFPIRSLALILLVIDSKVVGLIYLDNRLMKEIFSDKDQGIMMAIATQLALAFKSATIHKQLHNLQNSFYEQQSISDQTIFNKEFPQIIGKSEALRNVLFKAKKVAETDATILVLGETGVGKELIARAIHSLSRRANNAFIPVNISALSESLLPSELFGHEKGAFTGALATKVGRFEMADKGTIFLDEIGNLSIEGQVKLLRVLQEKEFERVGSTKTIRSDFRLIAATNKDLQQMVLRGDFGSDLYYRLSSFPVVIPPLRERKQDIPDLVFYFMGKYSNMHLKHLKRIPNQEMEKLLEYSWPGNIRELEHIIERSVIMSQNEVLLIPEIRTLTPYNSHSIQIDHRQEELATLSDIEKKHIMNILNHSKWRIRGEKGAAKILGLKPSTLEFRMKKLGIQKG
jgi:transcriptional regulator with GAF, ATPase, and Fis domain/tetratricopeptide (TPR) repeat protein